MPRGRCHFAMLHLLHERLREALPEMAELADRFFPHFVAGSVAPDALRILGKMGKLPTHFYDEEDRDTWGKSVSGMFASHPDLADPGALEEVDQVLLMGYLSHLTVDEAFRDTITTQVHGIDIWRPIIQGLWSWMDEMPIGYTDLIPAMDGFVRQDHIGFIDCGVVKAFLDRTRPWAEQSDPWRVEKVFLGMIESDLSDEEAKREMEAHRALAAPFLEQEQEPRFVEEAMQTGLKAIRGFFSGRYLRADP
ncbi:MAG: zinc dependent phospholipase C family protein [bacterium]|nr:zinc dependent phospholipase C family protein [bacterium]